jgi:hypothetical protein
MHPQAAGVFLWLYLIAFPFHFFAPLLFLAADLLRPLLFFAVDLLRLQLFFGADFFFAADFFFGTFAPFFLASDNPIAIACFRLVTFFPLLPLFSVPVFRSCIARFTFFCAPLEYFAIT